MKVTNLLMSDTKVVYGRWFTVKYCVHCDERLSHEDIHRTQGTCPYCGHTDKSTIVAYGKKVFRKIEVKRRWLYFFWRTVSVCYEEKVNE